MAQRAFGIAVAVTGVFFVICLLMLRFDVQGAAQKGSKWKRNLILTGLLVLAAMGLFSFTDIYKRLGKIGGVPAHSAERLEGSYEWRRLQALWRDAEPIASMPQDSYPFDKEEKAHLLRRLGFAKRDIDALERAGLICNAEANILKKDFAELTYGIDWHSTVEEKYHTCYLPGGGYQFSRRSVKTFSGRLKFLEKLAISERLHPAVTMKILEQIEHDTAAIRSEENLRHMSEVEKLEALDVCDKAEALIIKIRVKLKNAGKISE